MFRLIFILIILLITDIISYNYLTIIAKDRIPYQAFRQSTDLSEKGNPFG